MRALYIYEIIVAIVWDKDWDAYIDTTNNASILFIDEGLNKKLCKDIADMMGELDAPFEEGGVPKYSVVGGVLNEETPWKPYVEDIIGNL